MKILVIGDIFGKPGRKAVKELLPGLLREHGIDLVIANMENLAGGKGVDQKTLDEMWTAGVHVGTGGNHIWQNKKIYDFIDSEQRLVRPANYPTPCPGRGFTVVKTHNRKVAVINLLGRIYMQPLECPFRKADEILKELDPDIKIRILDFHAEATSEKIALSYYLDGRLSLVAGTHTHVQTADERILPRGSAAISDIGMTGSHDSVIGVRKGRVLEHFITGRPVSFQPSNKDIRLCGVIVSVSDETGKATAIERIRLPLGDAQ